MRQVKMRFLIALLICLLTVYAPIELTRLIIIYGLQGEFIFEVCFIWVSYIIGMGLVYNLVKERYEHKRETFRQ